ncbi:MAG: hypothetical protein ACKV0T_22220 [Planctomycetales bacterium]
MVASQLCRFVKLLASMPLGRFYSELVPVAKKGAFFLKSPPDPPLPAEIGFAEVYWADVPRGLAKDRYSLEDAKDWAQTIVERVRAMDQENKGGAKNKPWQYDLVAMVIGEIAESIRILERLFFLAEKANLFRFDLGRILVDYLGDVQIVTEFKDDKDYILEKFDEVMTGIDVSADDTEIYLIAHSEGTVVTLLGLLKGLQPEAKPWAKHVRGLMTIGSPLNKHVLVWPTLFEEFSGKDIPAPRFPIKWRNYYDYGDPVGFQLDITREWLRTNGWIDRKDGRIDQFEFDASEHDIGFTRYIMPGKAHNDYWQDEEVFGHFFEDVVGLTSGRRPAADPPGSAGGKSLSSDGKSVNPTRKFARPRSRWLASVISPLVSFVLAAALLVLAVFVFAKAFSNGIGIDETVLDLGWNVAGTSLLLAGVTAAVRIPRLTRDWGWRASGVLFLLAAGASFPFIITEDLQELLGSASPFGQLISNQSLPNSSRVIPGTTLEILALAAIATAGLCVFSWLRPGSGAKPLVFVGGALVFGIAILMMRPSSSIGAYPKFKAVLHAQGLRGSKLEKMACAVTNDPAKRDSISPGSYNVPKLAQDGGQMDRTKLVGEVNDVGKAGPSDALPTSGQTAGPPERARSSSGNVPVAADAELSERGSQSNEDSPNTAATGEVDYEKVSIWPVLLAGAAFVYLWWLAALVFDLAVVWKIFIRNSAILDRLYDVCNENWDGTKGIMTAELPNIGRDGGGGPAG